MAGYEVVPLPKPSVVVPVVAKSDPEFPPDDPHPQSFRYRGQLITVDKVLGHWREAGRWWEQEPEAVAWRIEAVGGGVYELLMYRTVPPRWILTGIYD